MNRVFYASVLLVLLTGCSMFTGPNRSMKVLNKTEVEAFATYEVNVTRTAWPVFAQAVSPAEVDFIRELTTRPNASATAELCLPTSDHRIFAGYSIRVARVTENADITPLEDEEFTVFCPRSVVSGDEDLAGMCNRLPRFARLSVDGDWIVRSGYLHAREIKRRKE